MPHVFVLASDHLGVRIVEQLRRDGCAVTVGAPDGSWLASAQLPEGVARVRLDGIRPTVDGVAEIATADALLAVTDEDEVNLGIAFEALEANPKLRVVLRQFNLRLGALLEASLPNCETLSLSALAAPTFALAALTPGVAFAHSFGADILVLREADDTTAGTVVARAGGSVLVATTARDLPPHPESPDRPGETKRTSRRTANRLLLWTLAYLAFAATSSAIYFALRLDMSPLDAVYFVVTIVTSVGFGDYSLRDADALSKLVGMWLMVSGVMSMAVIFAVVTNSLFDRQHAFERGQVRTRTTSHVVVCGLGVIGYRVAQTLRRLGHRVVVVESREDGRFVAAARAEGMHVVVGDASQDEAFRFANAGSARAVVVCTNPDFVNLEVALLARSLVGRVPVVLRLFDPDLSRRVAAHFDLDATLSSAALGAARFAAAATGSTRMAVVRFREVDVELHELEPRAGETVRAIGARAGRTPFAIVDDRGALRFDVVDDETPAPGERVVAV